MLHKVKSKLNLKWYWYAEKATEEFIKEDLPIFTRAEFAELKKYKISPDQFNMLWCLRCFKKLTIKESLREIGYFSDDLTPFIQVILDDIYKTLGKYSVSAKPSVTPAPSIESGENAADTNADNTKNADK